MKCAICGLESVRERNVNRVYEQGKDLLVIKNIPALVCTNCGEGYLDAETLHKLEEIREHSDKIVIQPIKVASFAA